MQTFGWLFQSTLVAEHERIPLDAVYDLSAMHYLNALTYIKAKREVDAEQVREMQRRIK